MAGLSNGRTALLISTIIVLAACQPGQNPRADKPDATGNDTAVASRANSVTLVDRDVEAPEVFQVTDEALWDGRPSLGGVWVASPDAVDPERVILRNPANGKFVIGALFKRESFNPGPKLQISSDAAEALGILAGQPATISVTALRREEAPAEADATKPILDANEGVSATTLGETATAAIDAAEAKPSATAATAPPRAPKAPVVTTELEDAPAPASAPAPVLATAPAQKPQAGTATVTQTGSAAPQATTPAPATAPQPAPAAVSSVSLQIGIFSVEANANRAVETLKKAGLTATARKETTQGKTWWSVSAAGPGPRDALLAKVKGLGFTDAYAIR